MRQGRPITACEIFPPPLADLAAALAAGRITSRVLTDAALARIADPAGEGARTFTRVYGATARDAADASDRRRAAGRTCSLLDGIPISIKDLFDVAGEPTTAGSVILADAPPAGADAPIVQRLRAAGAVIIGKTNMTEFAFSGLGLNPHHGTPKNPYDPARIPGGSSSGAGAAVSYGYAAASIGTDTGGSVRIPAAFCGLAGFKPTARRVPRAGTVPLSVTFDSIGPLAPTVACCALLDAILAGEAGVPLSDPPVAGLRLAIPRDFLTANIAPVVASAFERALRRLVRAGAELHLLPFPTPALLDEFYRRGGIVGPEAYAWHRDLLIRHRDGYDPHVRARIEAAARFTAADFVAAKAARAGLIAGFDRATAPFDALLVPTVAVPPPRFDEVAADQDYARVNALVLRNTALFNMLDRCAATMPCHAPGELPVGLMVVGETGGDQRLLAVAQAIERTIVAGDGPGA